MINVVRSVSILPQLGADCKDQRFPWWLESTALAMQAHCSVQSVKDRLSRFVLLMDGDVIGPSQWEPIRTAVSKHGTSVDKFLFETREPTGAKKALMSKLGTTLKAVARRTLMTWP